MSKKALLLTLITLVFFVLLFVILNMSKKEKREFPSLSLSPSFSDINNARTFEDIIQKIGEPEEKVVLDDYSIYKYNEKNSVNRKHELIFRNNDIFIIKEIITEETNIENIIKSFTSLVDPIELFGPQQESGISLFVSPNLGMAFLVNDENETPVFFEVWFFSPSPINDLLLEHPFSEFSYTKKSNQTGY